MNIFIIIVVVFFFNTRFMYINIFESYVDLILHWTYVVQSEKLNFFIFLFYGNYMDL